ncbi:MAG: insulinase family protein [Bryobacter sp.]|jgi:zinc protease|nr:insulinase family protein [Bryobacter sp. CoA8 C33]
MKQFFILTLAVTITFAQKPAPAPVPVYKTLKYPPLKPVQIPSVEQFTLPNGLKVLILENHELPLASGSLRIRTGSLLEPAEKAGLASLTGTVLRSGGTKRMKPDDLNARLESMAANIEAGINDDNATVSFNCLKENLDEVFGLFKEVVTEPAFAQDRFDLAVTQTRSGISRRNDDAADIRAREFQNILFGRNTPFADRLEYATLNNIKREDLIAFHDRYFFPSNAMLSIYGDVDTATVKAKLESLFGSWNVQRPPVPAFPQITRQKSAGVFIADKPDVEQTSFTIGQIGGKLNDKDYAALTVLSNILGGAGTFSSRLMQKIRSDMSLVYGISSSWSADYLHDGTFTISGSTAAATTGKAIVETLKEVKRMREELVGPTELEAAKQRVENTFVFQFASPAQTLSRLARYQYYGYPSDFNTRYKDAVSKVTAQDILRVAKEYIKPEDFTIVAVGPVAKFADDLKVLGEVSKLDITIPQPKQESAKSDASTLAAGRSALAKVVSAVGGLDKVQAVNDYTQSLSSELSMGGNKVSVKQTNMWLKPMVFRQVNELPFGKIIAFFDGEKGFLKAPQGEQPLAGPFAAQVRGQLQRDYFALLLSNETPSRSVNLVEEGIIELKDQSGPVLRFHYDPKTMMPAKLAFSEGGMNAEVAFGNFREVNGIRIPFEQKITQNGQSTVQTITDFKINSGLTLAQMSAKE